jgi:peptide/nickel transport system ATP-binding protein
MASDRAAGLAPDEDVAATRKPLLRVQNLTVAFERDPRVPAAVEQFSFDLLPRETLAIVGESGSGKSVSVLSILQLLPQPPAVVRDGRAIFDDRDLLALPEEQINLIRGNAISMIFQEPMTSLNPVLTVRRQLTEVLVTHQGLAEAEAARRAVEMLGRVRISDPERRLAQYPHQLSGGMRQRIMIAMALACRPRILIADEPTTALDVTIQAQILDLVRRLKAEFETAVILITHDMGVVAEMADRVIVMRDGRKVEEGLVHDIFDRPQHPYTRALLSAVPRLGAAADRPGPRRFVLPGETPPPATPAATTKPRPRPPDAALTVRNLSVRFDVRSGLLRRLTGRIHAVEDVSFTVATGETLGLVGESGCGKSTTGRAILRFEDPAKGEIRIGSEDVTRRNRRRMRPVRRLAQMVFQDPFASLNPRLTVGDQIAEPLIIHHVARGSEVEDRVVGLLRRVGLSSDLRRRYPHEFSGGQRQRICIARALALQPKLIIADEAVSALDVSIQAQVVNLLLDLQAEFGIAYLFISHDMAVVERISHRVAVMYLGRIVELGPRQAVFADPRHPYTRRLLAAVPVADPRRARNRPPIAAGELPSLIRPSNWIPPQIEMFEVSPGHLVAADE